MRISDRIIGPEAPPYVIAEIGVNHDGDADRARSLAHACCDAGADAVKFQYFSADALLSADAKLAAYQKDAGATDPVQMLRALELALDDIASIVDDLHRRHTHALVTIFSLEHVAPARTVAFDAWKTASPDIIHHPLLRALSKDDRPMIVSTGAADLQEIDAAAKILGHHVFALLHCVSSYPTDDDHAALGGIHALRDSFDVPVGYSDHTTSTDTGALAVAAGAVILEKHVTWNRNASGPDHAASLEPDELASYIDQARRGWRMTGAHQKVATDHERDVRTVARQSLVATSPLSAGATITRDILTVRRPGTGLPPTAFDDVLGRTLRRDVDEHCVIHEDDLQ